MEKETGGTFRDGCGGQFRRSGWETAAGPQVDAAGGLGVAVPTSARAATALAAIPD